MKWRAILLASIAIAMCSVVLNAYAVQASGHREQVVKFIDEVWTKGNLAYIDQAMDPSFERFGHKDEGNAVGIPAFKEKVRQIRSAFTDYNVTLVDMMGVGDKATFTWRLRGNYVGIDKKLSPGRAVDIMGKTVWFFRGDKVVKEIVEIDQEEYHRQIEMALPYSEVENKAVVLSYLYEVMSRGNVSALDELVSNDHVLHDANNVTVRGIEALREHVLAMRTAFPDLSIVIRDIVADGNLVTARWTVTGTHKGEWDGIAPTGVRIEASGLSFAYVKNGRMVETWSMWDVLKLRTKVAGS
jgi:steroid delta-isomerase-like uncharacterized protein